MTAPIERKPLRVARRATAAGGAPKLLEAWRALDAYVLLGDPGSGKSESFRAEANASGCRFVRAGDFIAAIDPPVATGETLFIDGLDEVRAGAEDRRAPFDLIRQRLHELGRPRFRLSCREADWLGQRDTEALRLVAPNAKLEVLHLDPLDRADILAVLRDRCSEVPDAEAFLREADRASLMGMLGNALLLDLTIKSVAASGWRKTRYEIYEHACHQLAKEHSSEHRVAKPPKPGDIDSLLNDAGLLCAVMLLTNKTRVALHADDAEQDLLDLSALPESLALRDARVALASKVFVTTNGVSAPRHRSIAEYLGARALARLIGEGLPLGRVLALMLGFDGKPIESLRGLFGWLAVHDAPDRARLIRLDPLAIVLNGDVAAFSTTERVQMLEALRDEAERDPWFRNNVWVSHPFGPLATADMLATYQGLLSDHDPSRSHQVFIDCVLDALTHGEPMPALAPALEAWVEDAAASIENRRSAYAAWRHNAGFLPAKARQWLDRFHTSDADAEEDRLKNLLLDDLYPADLGPDEVLRYLRPRRRHGHIDLSSFWDYELIEKSRPQDFAVLANAWVRRRPTWATAGRDFASRKLRSKLLAAALEHAGDTASTERLYDWLGIGLDEHGSSSLDEDFAAPIRAWLEARPTQVKSVLALGYERVAPDAQGSYHFWDAEERLHRAKLPRDWLQWLLGQAAATTNEALAKYLFDRAAWAAINPPVGFDVPALEDIEGWVDVHAKQWPQAKTWREDAWSMKLTQAYQRDELMRERKRQAEEIGERSERRQMLEPHWSSVRSGKPWPSVMHHLALAHNKRFFDIKGESGLDRLQDYLVSDIETAQAALEAIDRVLDRDDLPSVDDVLAQESKGKGAYFLQEPALLAARRLHERDPESVLALSDALIELLVAFHLVDGTGEKPDWYKLTVEQKPELVAPVLIRYAAPKLRRKTNTAITGLWALSHDPTHAALVRLVLPALLEGFPTRSSEPSRNELNRSLLAALPLLDDAQAARIVRLKLDHPSLDAAQRICWLVADLPYRAEAIEHLAAWVGKNERRAVMLGVSLYEQGSLGRTLHRLSPSAVCALIEMLAAFTPQDRRLGMVITSGVTHNREDTVRDLFTALSSNPSAVARDALLHLSMSTRIGHWQSMADYSVRAQRATAREAQFQTPELAAVANALANKAPATAADLQALVVDHLADLEKHLRHTDAYLVRQFWTENKEPHVENRCRDVLLTALRDKLKLLGVHLDPERRAAADKRADMVASFLRAGQRVALPIEVKKDSHPKNDHTNLWIAWRDQLQALYATDPAAGGYGIYLVLWFGIRQRSNPEGIKPTSPEHLRELLIARIPDADRTRLAVVVLDLSMPD